MKLKDRIKNIKTILKFCENNEVEIYNETCINYFTEFFKNRHDYPESFTGVVTVGNFLNSVAINPTLKIEYCYKDKDGDYDNELITFYDPDSEYMYGSDWGNSPGLDYSDIDDGIWKIVEEIAYKRKKKKILLISLRV